MTYKSGDIERLRDTVVDIMDRYEQNFAIVGNKDKLTCDLQHEAEFSKYDVKRIVNWWHRFQACRQERREAKDENEILAPTFDVLNNYPMLASELGKAFLDAQKIEKAQSKRYYRLRIGDGILINKNTEVD